ncbi:MAG: hypothetical protein HFI87_03595 [Bacilli bacterium]|nr:hypothetical protein [Bacilli bacterium]
MIDNINEIINVVDLNWTKDEIIRFLYVKLAPFFERDLSYFLAPEDEQFKIYQNGFKQNGRLVVCQTICEIYQLIYKEFKIDSHIIATNSKSIPHYALIVNGNHGWYYIDPLKDLFANQLGLKTEYFGCIPKYGSVKEEYPFLKSLSDQYIKFIDTKLKLVINNFYMDNFFDILNKEMTNNKAHVFFDVSKNDYISIILGKLRFANNHIINMGKIPGLYERLIFYKFIINKIYKKNEKKVIEPSLIFDKDKYALLLDLNFKTNSLHMTFREKKDNNGKYYLKKIK